MKDLFDFELRQQLVACEQCGASFMRRRTNHYFCSSHCKIYGFRKRRREELKELKELGRRFELLQR